MVDQHGTRGGRVASGLSHWAVIKDLACEIHKIAGWNGRHLLPLGESAEIDVDDHGDD